MTQRQDRTRPPAPRPRARSPRARTRRRLRPGTTLALALVVALLGASCTAGTSGTATGAGSTATTIALPACPLAALAGAKGPVDVTIWHFLAGKTGDALKVLADRYNASQAKVRVRVESQGTSNEELFKKYQSGIKNGDLPAIAVMDDTVTRQLIDSKTVLPAQSCINADHVDSSAFLKSGRDYYSVNGVQWPASVNLSGALLYYNRGHFRKTGLDPETAPKTLDEVRRYARKIKDAGVVGKPVALKVNSPMIEMWLSGAGSPVVNNDNGRGAGATDQAAFDNATTAKLYAWINSMRSDGLLDVIPDTSGQIGQYLAMAQGKASMTIETSTAATSVEAFLGGKLDPASVGAGTLSPADPNALDLGAAEVPGIDAPGKLGGGGGAWYIMNTTKPEVQAAAWDFMKFFNSLDSQVTWNTQASYLPFLNAVVSDPRVTKAWTTTLSGRWLALAYRELTNGVDPKFPGPLMGPYEQFRSAIRASIDAMVFKGTSPGDAISTAARATTTALAQYNRENF